MNDLLFEQLPGGEALGFGGIAVLFLIKLSVHQVGSGSNQGFIDPVFSYPEFVLFRFQQ
ncbi:hypothetical protein ES703_61585 [subsurface metagenome]